MCQNEALEKLQWDMTKNHMSKAKEYTYDGPALRRQASCERLASNNGGNLMHQRLCLAGVGSGSSKLGELT